MGMKEVLKAHEMEQLMKTVNAPAKNVIFFLGDGMGINTVCFLLHSIL